MHVLTSAWHALVRKPRVRKRDHAWFPRRYLHRLKEAHWAVARTHCTGTARPAAAGLGGRAESSSSPLHPELCAASGLALTQTRTDVGRETNQGVHVEEHEGSRLRGSVEGRWDRRRGVR